MYDLEGTDTGREWIEIQNTGTNSVDVSAWKLREADTNHGLTVIQGSSSIAPGGFAVIADNSTKFLADTPGYTGLLLDSSFSLSNTGETLALKDENLIDVDSVTYSSEQGAVGDGNSLQWVSGSWSPGAPTPAAANAATPLAKPQTSSQTITSGESSSNSNTHTSGAVPSVEQQIFPNAGGNKSGIVGADILFEGSALGTQKQPLGNARYIWNFGDGGTAEGQRVLHRYRHPGEYHVVLTVAAGENSNSVSITATVVNNGVVISGFTAGPEGFVELSNTTDMDIDISRWVLKGGPQLFTLPAGTELPAHKTSRLSNDISGITQGPLSLLYPNGTEAVGFEEKITLLTSVDTSVPSEPTAPRAPVTPVAVRATQTMHTESNPVQGGGVATADPVESEARAQTASVGNVPASPDSANWLWYLALGGLILAGGAGMVFMRPKSTRADEYEIIEEEA